MGKRQKPARADAFLSAGVPIIFLAFAILAITTRSRDTDPITSLPQSFPLLQGLDVVAGMSTLVVGALAWVVHRRSVGLPAMLAGLSWFGPDWAGNTNAPTSLRAVALLVVVLTLPLVAWAVAATRPPRMHPVARNGILVITAALIGLTVAWLATWEPSLDPRCLAICDVNPLGIAADFRMARNFANAWQSLTTVLGAVLAASSLMILAQSSRATRRQRGPLLTGAVLVGLAWVCWGVSMLLPSTVVAPSGPVAIGLFVARGLALTSFAIGLGWWVLNLQRTIQAVRLLAARNSPFPEAGTLVDGLAKAFADPELRLVYALPEHGGYVAADGQIARVDEADLSGERVTEIRNGEDVVAVALHSGTASQEPISPELGADVRLAADNERLLASVRHELRELRASRARIVETGDAARRGLERNLHDGAQQRMLMVVHELAVARDLATAAGHPASESLTRAMEEADATIEALRALARGIHPAFLEEAGLSAALEALADEAPLPVIVDAVPDARFEESVELAAWRTCAQSVAEAARHGATSVRLSLASDELSLSVQIDIDGLPDSIDTIGLEDVAGAAGGTLAVSDTSARAMRIVAELPCE